MCNHDFVILNKCVSQVNDVAYGPPVNIYTYIYFLLQSDVIVVLGNHDLRTAQRGAELWLQGMAPWILFSGREGANTRGDNNRILR